jgi:hypothetical protein
MSGAFKNIDPPPPHHPASVYPPSFGAGVGNKAVNREDKLSRRYRDRDLAKFESSRRYRER